MCLENQKEQHGTNSALPDEISSETKILDASKERFLEMNHSIEDIEVSHEKQKEQCLKVLSPVEEMRKLQKMLEEKKNSTILRIQSTLLTCGSMRTGKSYLLNNIISSTWNQTSKDLEQNQIKRGLKKVVTNDKYKGCECCLPYWIRDLNCRKRKENERLPPENRNLGMISEISGRITGHRYKVVDERRFCDEMIPDQNRIELKDSGSYAYERLHIGVRRRLCDAHTEISAKRQTYNEKVHLLTKTLKKIRNQMEESVICFTSTINTIATGCSIVLGGTVFNQDKTYQVSTDANKVNRKGMWFSQNRGLCISDRKMTLPFIFLTLCCFSEVQATNIAEDMIVPEHTIHVTWMVYGIHVQRQDIHAFLKEFKEDGRSTLKIEFKMKEDNPSEKKEQKCCNGIPNDQVLDDAARGERNKQTWIWLSGLVLILIASSIVFSKEEKRRSQIHEKLVDKSACSANKYGVEYEELTKKQQLINECKEALMNASSQDDDSESYLTERPAILIIFSNEAAKEPESIFDSGEKTKRKRIKSSERSCKIISKQDLICYHSVEKMKKELYLGVSSTYFIFDSSKKKDAILLSEQMGSNVTGKEKYIIMQDGNGPENLSIEIPEPDCPFGSSVPLSPTEAEGVQTPSKTFTKRKTAYPLRLQIIPGNSNEDEKDISLTLTHKPLIKVKDSRESLQKEPFYDLPLRRSSLPISKSTDASFHMKDFIRSIWGSLPVPKIELTVAFKQLAETPVQSKPASQQTVNSNFEPLDNIIKKIADDQAPGPQITMQYELLRICTLRNYPKDNKPWLTQLAAAGFYYAAEGDEVICYCCGLRRHSWISTDIPERIHQRINPNCKFLNRNSEFNVPIKYEGSTPNMIKIEALLNKLQEEEVPAAITNGAEGGSDVSEYAKPIAKNTNELKSPKHPQYVSRPQRISSFEGWPDSLTQTPEIMAEAGFYYAGFGDCVRCYYCGIGLRHWTKEDNPWIEHARWSQHCAFVKQVKGQEFINLVQMAVEVSQNNENQESEASSDPTGETSERSQREQDEVENILRTDPAQSVLEMGYQPRIIKKAIDFILKREGRSGISSQKIMEKVMEYEDAESARDLVGELAHMDLHRQDSATGGPASAEHVSGGSVKTGEIREKSAKASVNAKENVPKKKHSHHSGELARSNRDPNRPTAKDIKEENHRLKEQTLCKVCLDNTVCIVFLPCGHLCTCDDCAPAMRTCPICRQDVKGTVKTYMS